MLDFLKDINKLRQMQSAVKQERAESEKNGVRVVINGGMEIEQVSLNPELSVEDQARAVKDAINDAYKKIQMTIAQKFYSQQ